jgi:hypothetical protein
MPAHHAGPQCLLTLGTRAGGNDHWRDAEDESKPGHQNWPEAQIRCLDGRFDQRFSLRPESPGEFDNQNSVLGGETDDGHKSDREIDIPRSVTAITAPHMPSGTTKSTDIGIVQLSYKAARSKNTTSAESPSNNETCEPASFSCND